MSEEIMEVVPEVEVTVEEAIKHIDGESFAIGTVIGTAATAGIWLLVKKVVIPGTKKLKIKIRELKEKKVAEYESDGFEEA